MPEIERQQAEGKRVAFRADAAFAKPEIYDALEARGVDHVIRMPANESLEWEIAELPAADVHGCNSRAYSKRQNGNPG